MCFSNSCPASYENFSVFRKEFEASSDKSYEARKGRLVSLGRFLLSPISIPSQILARIGRLFASVIRLVSATIGLLEFKKIRVVELKKAGLNFADSLLDLVTSPLTLVAEKVRYLAGIIYPKAVFTLNIRHLDYNDVTDNPFES